jgi:hypothetical protein
MIYEAMDQLKTPDLKRRAVRVLVAGRFGLHGDVESEYNVIDLVEGTIVFAAPLIMDRFRSGSSGPQGLGISVRGGSHGPGTERFS